MNAMARGQDRSAWQTIGPWDVQGCTWGIAKATEGLDFQDPHFPANWALMHSQLQHRGAYHFLHPQLDPELQADYFVAYVTAAGVGEQAILVADSELAFGPAGGLIAGSPASIGKRSHLLSVSGPNGAIRPREGVGASLLDIAGAMSVGESTFRFLDRVHEHRPHNPLWIYTNHNVGAMLDAADAFPVWMAWPSLAPPDMAGMPWTRWMAWQWAWTGGYDNSDQDVWNGTPAQMTAWVESFKAVREGDYKRWTHRGPWSLAREAAVHHTTPEDMIEVARRAGHLYKEGMEEYIEAGDWTRRVPWGAQLFAMVA